MSFIDDILTGKAKPEDIDDYIEDWHELLEEGSQSIYDFLGMTWEEYNELSESGESGIMRAVRRRAHERMEEIFADLEAKGMIVVADPNRIITWKDLG